MTVWIGGGGLVEQVIVCPEIGDVFAHGLFRDFVRIWFFGCDFLRGHVLLELARKEVHDYNLVSGGAGGIGVGLRFPRMQVGVVNDHQIDTVCQRAFECLQIASVIFAEPSDVKDIPSVFHEVFVCRMNGDGKPRARDRGENVLCECRLARSRDGAVDEDGFHMLFDILWSERSSVVTCGARCFRSVMSSRIAGAVLGLFLEQLSLEFGDDRANAFALLPLLVFSDLPEEYRFRVAAEFRQFFQFSDDDFGIRDDSAVFFVASYSAGQFPYFFIGMFAVFDCADTVQACETTGAVLYFHMSWRQQPRAYVPGLQDIVDCLVIVA